MLDQSFEIGAAEQSDDRSSQRTAVPERPLPKDACVGGSPVNASSDKLEDTGGARPITTGPTVAGSEAATDVILVESAGCDQRFRDVERHLGIVRPPEPAEPQVFSEAKALTYRRQVAAAS